MISTFTHSLAPNFFEDVTLNPLDHLTDAHRVKTDKYFIFNYRSSFRGFKATYSSEQLPFFLYHEEVFRGACQVFENLFNHPPDLVRVFFDQEKTWNAFLVTSRFLAKDETDFRDWPIVEPDQSIYGWQSPDIFEQPTTRSLQHDREFHHFPLIGAINDYSYDATPAFFYLIATPFRQSFASFLTLSNFRFLKDADKKPFARSGPGRQVAMTRICSTVSDQFLAEQGEFNQLLSKMADDTIETSLFAPVVLDLYNRNRNLESIRNDSTLRSNLRKTHEQALGFSRPYLNLPWSDFIHYIIRYNEFDLNEDWLRNRIDELFAEKRSYKKFREVFSHFLTDQSRYYRYVNDQQADWERIKQTVYTD